MELSEHFKLEEFVRSETASRLHIDNTPTEDIIDNLRYLCETVLEKIRNKANKPLIISSGYRCKELNKAVGGVSNSQHCIGCAADIDVGTNDDNKKLFIIIEEMIKNNEIEVDQLLDEAHYKWIHISKVKNNNRNQILHL